jgi:uncharacterized repeat protein (TIGR01451 family)
MIVFVVVAASACRPTEPSRSASPSEHSETSEPQTIAASATTITTDTIIVPTYPYASFLYTATNATYNIPYRWLNWGQYEGSHPQPVDKAYTRLTLENQWLRVSVLPELGGRVYEMIFKPTGNNELYRNPVIKPTNWGPPEQGWWLAAGGIEWGLPVEEHGYESAIPWSYSIISDTNGVTVTVRDSLQPDRLRAAVSIFLPNDRAVLFVRPRIENDRNVDLNFKWWDNAMLAPGPGDSVGKYANNPNGTDLKFVFPETQVTVHSTGDSSLPQEGQAMAWPIYNSRDLSRLQNWRQWLGFFARPQASQDFVSVVDLAHQEGIVRIFPHTIAHGSKGFAMGWRNPIGAAQWTDDDSYYAELHGGLAPTFWDSVLIRAHQTIEWEETWYPLAGLNDVTSANREAALDVKPTGSALNVGVFSTRARTQSQLSVWQRSTCWSIADEPISSIDPSASQHFSIPTDVPLDDLAILFHDDVHLSNPELLIGYNDKDCVPPITWIDGLSFVSISTTVPVNWTGSDFYSGIAAYDVQFRDGLYGAWTPWLTATSAISATFSGVPNHTYFFRVRGHDAQGNIGEFSGAGGVFTTILLQPAPVMELSTKSVSPFFAVNQPIDYLITLNNFGTAIGHIRLTDTLPLSMTLISGTLYAYPGVAIYDGSHVLWNGLIGIKDTASIGYALTPTTDLPPGSAFTNTAFIEGGVVPVTRTATTMLALNVYLPIITRNFAP